MEKTTFEKYFESAGWDEQHRSFAKMVWDAAIAAATELVERNYDECEPWLTPDMMDELSA